jgi:hypothetical protein
MRVTNGIPLECSLLQVGTVNSVQTLKASTIPYAKQFNETAHEEEMDLVRCSSPPPSMCVGVFQLDPLLHHVPASASGGSVAMLRSRRESDVHAKGACWCMVGVSKVLCSPCILSLH